MKNINRENLNLKYMFDNFIVGDGNKAACGICIAVAEMPGLDSYNPLYLYGNSGVGKTHLMQAIAHHILQNDEKAKVLYVTSEQFVNELIGAIRNQTLDEFRKKYMNLDVLLIDDIQFLEHKENTQTEFFNILNTFYDNMKQIIVSSDRVACEMKTFNERLISRLEGGVHIDICEPDYETRMAILKNKVERDNIKDIPEEIFAYIAINITDNVRRLEGALNKVAVYYKLMNEKVTLEAAKEWLKDLIDYEG